MRREDKFFAAASVIIILMAIATPFLSYYSDPTVESEVVNTRSETTGGGHQINAWADVTNTDNETGRACVHFNFVERGGDEVKQHTSCVDGLEPGETVTVSASVHADGKAVTYEEVRGMNVRAFAEEPRDPDSIFNLQ